VLYLRDSQIWRYDEVEKFHDPTRPRIEITIRSFEP
jgi:Holliday junction resolvase RusA-like endonuclease